MLSANSAWRKLEISGTWGEFNSKTAAPIDLETLLQFTDTLKPEPKCSWVSSIGTNTFFFVLDCLLCLCFHFCSVALFNFQITVGLLLFHSVFIVQIAQQGSFGLFQTITVNLMIMCMRGVPLPYFCLNIKIYSAPCLKPGPVFITSIKNSVHPDLALIFWQKIYLSKIGATYFYWHSSCSTQLCPLLCLLQLSVCPFSYLQALCMLNSVHFGFGG